MKCKQALVLGCELLAVGAVFFPLVCFAQTGEESADQAAFQDDVELMRLNNSQIRQIEHEEQAAELQAAADEQRNTAYRLYAEKRVNDLEKLKSGNSQNDRQIAILQRWLKIDAAMRLRDQQTIAGLRQRIAAMENTQQASTANLSNDVASMREAALDARSDARFKQQMEINYFNELQSEMGPAHMVHQNTGPSYGMGGMGFNGGQTLFGGGY